MTFNLATCFYIMWFLIKDICRKRRFRRNGKEKFDSSFNKILAKKGTTSIAPGFSLSFTFSTRINIDSLFINKSNESPTRLEFDVNPESERLNTHTNLTKDSILDTTNTTTTNYGSSFITNSFSSLLPDDVAPIQSQTTALEAQNIASNLDTVITAALASAASAFSTTVSKFKETPDATPDAQQDKSSIDSTNSKVLGIHNSSSPVDRNENESVFVFGSQNQVPTMFAKEKDKAMNEESAIVENHEQSVASRRRTPMKLYKPNCQNYVNTWVYRPKAHRSEILINGFKMARKISPLYAPIRDDLSFDQTAPVTKWMCTDGQISPHPATIQLPKQKETPSASKLFTSSADAERNKMPAFDFSIPASSSKKHETMPAFRFETTALSSKSSKTNQPFSFGPSVSTFGCLIPAPSVEEKKTTPLSVSATPDSSLREFESKQLSNFNNEAHIFQQNQTKLDSTATTLNLAQNKSGSFGLYQRKNSSFGLSTVGSI